MTFKIAHFYIALLLCLQYNTKMNVYGRQDGTWEFYAHNTPKHEREENENEWKKSQD